MKIKEKSLVTLEKATPEESKRHFEAKLKFETDPWDVAHDLKNQAEFMLLDVRSENDFLECHIPGALNFPNRNIAKLSQNLDPQKLIVVYCWGPGCNGAHKAAAKLAKLGFQVKEMIGGIEYWRREGYAVEGTNPIEAPLVG